MKDIIHVSCKECGKITKGLKKEWGGVLLLLFFIPYLFIFGIEIHGVLSLTVGSYWIITQPSKKVICEECLAKKEENNPARQKRTDG